MFQQKNMIPLSPKQGKDDNRVGATKTEDRLCFCSRQKKQRIKLSYKQEEIIPVKQIIKRTDDGPNTQLNCFLSCLSFLSSKWNIICFLLHRLGREKI